MNSYLDLFLTFARIGGLTFGGGYAMLPMLQKEVVEKRNWYKIKTSNDLEGWICENVGNEKYVELLEQK